MTFDELIEQVRELLRSKGRVAYRALKRRFEIDDEYLEDLKAELIDAEHVAHDEDGKVLVWAGGATKGETAKRVEPNADGSGAHLSLFAFFPFLLFALPLICAVEDELSQQPRAESGRAFCDVGFLMISPRRTRNVEMRPGLVAYEVL